MALSTINHKPKQLHPGGRCDRDRYGSLQLHVQSVPITTKVVSSNPSHGKVYSIQHYKIKFVSDLSGLRVSPGTPGFPTNKTDRHDTTEILLKVALNTINQPTKPTKNHFHWIIRQVI